MSKITIRRLSEKKKKKKKKKWFDTSLFTVFVSLTDFVKGVCSSLSMKYRAIEMTTIIIITIIIISSSSSIVVLVMMMMMITIIIGSKHQLTNQLTL